MRSLLWGTCCLSLWHWAKLYLRVMLCIWTITCRCFRSTDLQLNGRGMLWVPAKVHSGEAAANPQDTAVPQAQSPHPPAQGPAMLRNSEERCLAYSSDLCSSIGWVIIIPKACRSLIQRDSECKTCGCWVPDLRLRRRSQGSSLAATLRWKTPAEPWTQGSCQ